jgi:SAM-dependent methyltransferase
VYLTSVQTPDQLSFWNKWHQTRGATGDDRVHRELREIFLGALPAAERRLKVLDLGCGQGHDVVAFMNAGHKVCGLDFSPIAVRKARRSLPKVRPWKRARVDLHEENIAAPLPFEDGSFDGVYSHLALHYFHDDVTREVFAEILRVTAPGGLFVFSVKSVDNPYHGDGERVLENLYLRKGHLRRFFTDGDIKDLLDGWEVEEVSACHGRYASPEPGAFFRAVARRPQ